MPESPRWLMLHDRYADTRKAFGQLGMETTEEEIRSAAEQLRGTVEERRRKTQWTRGRDPGADRGLRVLHFPADHRDQRSVLLRSEDPGELLPERAQCR